MAIHQLKMPPDNFTDGRKSDVDNTDNLTAHTDLASNATIRNALQTYDPLTYTDAVLDGMNVNDMIFAWRACKNPTSISSDFSAQTVRS